MWNWIRTTLNPAGYHGPRTGRRLRRPYFEGWYFKLVDAREKTRLVVIPGIFQASDPKDSHAFIQVLDGVSGEMTYHSFPAPEFQAAATGFDVRIGPNRFTNAGIALDIDDSRGMVRGGVHFHNPDPVSWPVTLLSPGIMGWYAWAPFMECYHGVLSFNHGLHGSLRLGAQTCDFTGGRGYIEKDWGRAFPSAWIWLQTNHFRQPETCLTASIAQIPWLGSTFPGFIVGLWQNHRLYRFATYTGARIQTLEVRPDRVDWILTDGQYTLEITAHRANGGQLQAPTPSGMDRRIAETLDARVAVRLRQGDQILFEDMGRHAGFEAVGDLSVFVHGA